MQQFFSGSVTNYSIDCDYCDGQKIILKKPLNFNKIIDLKNIKDVVGFGSKFPTEDNS